VKHETLFGPIAPALSTRLQRHCCAGIPKNNKGHLMKPTLVAAFALLCVTQTNAQDTHASFFANDPVAQHAETQTQSPAQPARPSRLNVRIAAHVAPAEGASSGGVYALVDSAAQRHGVPVRLARSIVRHESGGRCNARGRHGELGPLQIKPSTARGLGYSGPASALATCSAGLEWGMRHLALAMRKCGHPGPHNYGLGGGCARTAYVRKVMASS
jgi:hypothetical protein